MPTLHVFGHRAAGNAQRPFWRLVANTSVTPAMASAEVRNPAPGHSCVCEHGFREAPGRGLLEESGCPHQLPHTCCDIPVAAIVEIDPSCVGLGICLRRVAALMGRVTAELLTAAPRTQGREAQWPLRTFAQKGSMSRVPPEQAREQRGPVTQRGPSRSLPHVRGERRCPPNAFSWLMGSNPFGGSPPQSHRLPAQQPLAASTHSWTPSYCLKFVTFGRRNEGGPCDSRCRGSWRPRAFPGVSVVSVWCRVCCVGLSC